MNLAKPLSLAYKLRFSTCRAVSNVLPQTPCIAFGANESGELSKISRIYVINLDRRLDRWSKMQKELRRVLAADHSKLIDLTVRWSAIDAAKHSADSLRNDDIDPIYTLKDQLNVEPQPQVLPDHFDLDLRIEMTPQELAVAQSHIRVWREIANGSDKYALIMEDDIWFRQSFSRKLNRIWKEFVERDAKEGSASLLFLSYKEVKGGAPKHFLSPHIFRPSRGLWYLSGYILSRHGARELLRLLPCRGPVDLWINLQFEKLSVSATRRPIIEQHNNGDSTNSYSVLPLLQKMGVIDDGGSSLFQRCPTQGPVFAYGPAKSGLSSLAMALSMLGYRCCHDLDRLPRQESTRLLKGRSGRIFDAYVNIGELQNSIPQLRKLYPEAKIITTGKFQGDADLRMDFSVMRSAEDRNDGWTALCNCLRCPPPASSFPEISDKGQRRLLEQPDNPKAPLGLAILKRDTSPWVIEHRNSWTGIATEAQRDHLCSPREPPLEDSLSNFNNENWFLREDTFPGNLGLFRPSNAEFENEGGIKMHVRKAALGVRDYSAAAVSSQRPFLYGRFEAEFRASDVPGVVTGFFLHRDSPRQEIDIEIAGNRPSLLLTNVFYNPGGDGAGFDYGYRGTPRAIELGFDASEAFHRYVIEWAPNEIRWLVDGELVCRRYDWDPTPIPHLPMTLHFNRWPTRSRELAGRLDARRLPAVTDLKFLGRRRLCLNR